MAGIGKPGTAGFGQNQPMREPDFLPVSRHLVDAVESKRSSLNGHEPYRYLKDLLERIPTQPASRLEELLPNRWLAH